MARKYSLALTVIVCLLICTMMVIAQESTGSMVGSAKDSTGAIIPGAKISIKDMEKGIVVRMVATNSEGQFVIPSLPVGMYEVIVEAAQFKKHISTGIKLDVNQRRTIDAILETGQITDVVTVEAAPLQVDLQTATQGNLITGDQIRELTLNNRNFVQLMTLMPGVSDDLDDQIYVGTSNPFGQANTMKVSVNGARASANQFTVDGANTNDGGSNLTIQTYPSVDSIGEFKVLRGLYTAEIGRSGGGQVNVVTRSGGKSFHGSAYEFFKNDALNANNFFQNTSRTPTFGFDENGKARRLPFRYNLFGGTIGGPVILPKKLFGPLAYNEDRSKTFFFFSTEYRRVIQYIPMTASIPDSNLRQGKFPVPICVKTAVVAGKTVCAESATNLTNINPVAQAYINEFYADLPNPTTGYTLRTSDRNVFNARQEMLKIDHNVSSRLQFSYRYQYDSIPTIDSLALFSSGVEIPGVSTTSTNSPGNTHVFRSTYSISNSLILEASYNYSYGAILSTVIGDINQANSPSIKVPLPFSNTRERVPTLTGHGFTGISGFGPYNNFSNNHAVSGNLSILSGAHAFKVGGIWNKYRKHENALAGNNEGIFSSFSTVAAPTTNAGLIADRVPAGLVLSQAVRDNLQRWANFLLGNAGSFTQSKFDFTADLKAINWEMFAQDEWRARPNVTIYYGIRYSRFGQPWDELGRLSNFDPSKYDPAKAIRVDASSRRVGTTGDPTNGIIINNDPNNPYGKKVANEDTNNWAPRIGIAWDPFKKGKTAIRTGYGMYYDQTLLGTYQQSVGLNPPFQETFSYTDTKLDNPTGVAATVSPLIRSLRATALPYKTPDYQHWTLNIQHQITSKLLGSVAYGGSKGTHLLGVVDINLLPPGKALNSQCLNSSNKLVQCQTPGQIFTTEAEENILSQIRPYVGYKAINTVQTRFNSNYHSLQSSLNWRMKAGNQLNLNYTLAKNLTDSQSDRSHAPQNPYNIKADYGRALYDRRHVFSLDYIYELPFFRQSKGFVKAALSRWQLSGIVKYQSGLALTATDSGRDIGGIGYLGPSASGPRPDQISDPNDSSSHEITEWFNKHAFARPTQFGVAGNAGRGTINGPGAQRYDVSLTKRFNITEAKTIAFRIDAFNIFNHTNFRGVTTNITSTLFGQVTSTYDPRIISLMLKFTF